MCYQYRADNGVLMSFSDDDRALMAWELSEARKDANMLRVRIRMQLACGCQERAGRLQRDYMRALQKVRKLQDRLFGSKAVAA